MPDSPYGHYQDNREIYTLIEGKLEAVNETFHSAPQSVKESMLFQASSFALISAQTRLKAHEKGYLGVIDAQSPDEINLALRGPAVQYHNLKTDYITHNAKLDYGPILDEWESGNLNRVHRMLLDNMKGLGIKKSAFTMAMLGETDKMCIDTHTAQACGLHQYDTYSGVVPEKYEEECEMLRTFYPRLAREVDPFIYQWVLFDWNMGTVTTHDPWFLSLPIEVEI